LCDPPGHERLASAAALIGLLGTSLSGQNPRPAVQTADALVAAAIADGIAGRAAPCRLPGANGVAVYTPAVRVALAAQAFHGQHQRGPDPRELAPWIVSPRVWVVFNRPDNVASRLHAVAWSRRTPLTDIAVDRAVTGAVEPAGRWRTAPVEVATDLSFLAALGPLPFDEPALAAAFEPGALQPGLWVFARWTLPNKDRLITSGRISEAALRATGGAAVADAGACR
jgi:hypothetical protein